MLKPHTAIPDDWSVKKGIELELTYEKTADLISAFDQIEKHLSSHYYVFNASSDMSNIN